MGMTAREAAALVRCVMGEARYGEEFRRGLGHRVGLGVHENSRAGWVSHPALQAGMTLTVEPGIYIASWGGVRIEDLVHVQHGGSQVLTRAKKAAVVRVE